MAKAKTSVIVGDVDAFTGFSTRILVDEEGKMVGLAFGDRGQVEMEIYIKPAVRAERGVSQGAVQAVAHQLECLAINLRSIAGRFHT